MSIITNQYWVKSDFMRVQIINQWLSYKNGLALIGALLLCCLLFNGLASNANEINTEAEQKFGPDNLLKTMRTPFTTVLDGEDEKRSTSSSASSLAPIAIVADVKPVTKKSLQERFHGPKLFLPTRMVLGQSAEFIIKGNPGTYAAIAMSESNKGAKPISGHDLRLGADRKLVAIGKIPEQGILSVFVEAPIQGDLIGLPLYFEGVIWSNPDFSDMQMASTITVTESGENGNSVIVSGQDEKKERAVVFDVSKPMSMRSMGTLNSGKP